MKSRMKVLLMDLDVIKQLRPYPNLALMKLSAYHKAKGDEVCLNFPLQQSDIIYGSCVFSWNAKERAKCQGGAFLGGSGIDLKSDLPPEVEHMKPDYSLYPNVSPLVKDSSIGFTSRGCIRKCPWCGVAEKEGSIRPAARIYEFWDRSHRKITLLDNNLLAAPNWKQTMEDLLAEKLEVDFNQGLDIRLLNEQNLTYLMQVKTKELRFAFDDIGYERAVRTGIELLLGNGLRSRKLSFYVLYGFGDDNTAIKRAKILQSYNVDIYPMAYKDASGREPQRKLLGEEIGNMMFHGTRGNINKFLRLSGRLTE